LIVTSSTFKVQSCNVQRASVQRARLGIRVLSGTMPL
jgi:hypothetical protein